VRHGGSWAGYRADLLRFPTARTSIACLCNVGSSIPSLFADRVADIVLAPQLAPKAGLLLPLHGRRSRWSRPGSTAWPDTTSMA